MRAKIMCNDKSIVYSQQIVDKLKANGFNIVESAFEADVIFVIGGDGTFLRCVRKNGYDSFPVYVGVNCGNLGYLQDVLLEDIDDVIHCLKKNRKIETNKIRLADIKIMLSNGKLITDNAINELQISGKHYHKMSFELSDGKDFTEKVLSSGIIFATPYGSTAYNKSIGGPVLCEGIDALCATLFAPIQNSKTNDYIQNSLVGKEFEFKPLSDMNDMEVIIDGHNIDLPFDEIEKINIQVGKTSIHKLYFGNKSYGKNMQQKMIKSD